MPNPDAGMDRLEDSMGRAFNAIEALAGEQEQLDNVITLLTEAQIKTEQRFQEAAGRSQQTDARFDKLASAIGELIRNGRAPAEVFGAGSTTVKFNAVDKPPARAQTPVGAATVRERFPPTSTTSRGRRPGRKTRAWICFNQAASARSRKSKLELLPAGNSPCSKPGRPARTTLPKAPETATGRRAYIPYALRVEWRKPAMPNPNARIDRLEDSMGRAFNAIEALADKQEKLDNVITLLTEAQIKTEQRFQEAAERSQQTDARIDKLVSAIGDLIRNGRAK